MPSLRRNSSDRRAKPPIEAHAEADIDGIIARLEEQGRPIDGDLLRSIYEFTAEMHKGQVRRSGEPYMTHPLAVAGLLADLHFGETCVAVGLMHDVLEDTLTTKEALAERFGEELAELVDGVTKIGKHEYVRRDEAQAETFRKLLLASTKDIRVIVVKLADRLHNMMTLKHMPPEKQRRISQETIEIYAPTARRLGMSRIQGDLEDLSFYYLYPRQYDELHEKIRVRVRHGRKATEKIRGQLGKLLEESGIEAEIGFRVKRPFSIFRKLREQGIDVSQLYDYLAYRTVTSSVRDCYASLGVVHQAWRPVPGRFKDYIAMPKPNLYQSLHTTLVAEGGQPFEVQIRTREMDLVAEEGIAAHWRYKEGGSAKARPTDENVQWLRQLLEWQQEVRDPRTFMTTLKIDLYPDEVYVFSPKGDVMALPQGATPLDFAYRIHTELGHHCVGAKVNGRLVQLKTELKNGDLVEIDTNPTRYPSRDWLSFVATSRAKSKIRQWLNTEQKKRATEVGRRLVDKDLKKYKVSTKRFLANPALEQYLVSEGFSRAEDLFAAIGFGKIAVRSLLNRVLDEEDLARPAEEPPGPLRRAVSKVLPFGGTAVRVKGQDDLLAYLAKCCSPVPGESIVGYITRGKGISVHSAECSNVKNLLYHPEREIEVEWASVSDEVYPVVLKIDTEDNPGMLARLTEVIAKHSSNIRSFDAETLDTGRGLVEVVVEVRDRKHLFKLKESLRSVQGVISVGRARGGGRRDRKN